MRMALWAATFALLLVGATTSHAQQAPADVPSEAAATECGGDRPCYLHQAHWKHVQGQVGDLQLEIEARRAELARMEGELATAQAQASAAATTAATAAAAAKSAADASTQTAVALSAAATATNAAATAAAIAAKDAAKQRDDLKAEVVAMKEELEAARKQEEARLLLPNWAGWHWGLNLQGQYQVGTHGGTFAPVQLGVFGRWVSREHLGIEAGLAGGVWFTEKWAPPMVSSHLHGVGSWQNWGIFIGPQLAALHSINLRGTMFPQVAVQAGGEFKAGGFHLRAWIAPAVSSPSSRTSGLGLGASVGFYH